MDNKNINQIYDDASTALGESIKKVSLIKLDGEEENFELTKILETLQSLNNCFKNEILSLKASSEWDNFCISFFGETNAGKSTIIESLRIIYDEEKRRAELEKKEKEYFTNLINHTENYTNVINSLKELNSFLQQRKPKKLLILNVIKSLLLLGFGFTLGLLFYSLFR